MRCAEMCMAQAQSQSLKWANDPCPSIRSYILLGCTFLWGIAGHGPTTVPPIDVTLLLNLVGFSASNSYPSQAQVLQNFGERLWPHVFLANNTFCDLIWNRSGVCFWLANMLTDWSSCQGTHRFSARNVKSLAPSRMKWWKSQSLGQILNMETKKTSRLSHQMGVSIAMGVPQKRWMVVVRENQFLEMDDDWRYPHLWKHPNLHNP